LYHARYRANRFWYFWQLFLKLKGGNMSIEFNGKTIETNATGFLVNQEDWSKELAEHMAKLEGITLTQKHWDLIDYLRDEFINNSGNQPNTRHIVKAMSDKWGTDVIQKDVYDLFPKDPSKQGGRIAGLPESRRKGGY
jgi:tRNA 2-thiouridine synthesizing protein E